MAEKLYTVKEVLDVLRISRTTLYRHIYSGLVKSLKIGGKILFTEGELSNLLKKLKKGK